LPILASWPYLIVICGDLHLMFLFLASISPCFSIKIHTLSQGLCYAPWVMLESLGLSLVVGHGERMGFMVTNLVLIFIDIAFQILCLHMHISETSTGPLT